MAQNSYIKDLIKYPIGGSAIYADTGSCVTITNNNTLGLSKDGTGINELWKYRSQFTLPTPVNAPNCTPQGRNVTDTTTYSGIANYFATHIANTSLTGNTPYSASQLKGAETFYVQFVTGKAESAPSVTDKYHCSWKDLWGCIMKGWCWAQKQSGHVFSELGDDSDCFVWNYFNDSSFSIRIHGGYGSTGQFKVTLTNPYTGTIASTAGTTTFTEGTTITYNIPRASNSGQGRQDVGEYILTVVDIVTNATLVVYIFVPLSGAPAPNNVFRMRNRFFSQSFTPGATFCANNDNSVWIMPAPLAPTIPTCTLAAPVLSATNISISCISPPRSIITFKAIIDENTTDVTYKFQQKIAPATTWTDVAPASTISAADISLYQQTVTAQLITNVAALTGDWQLILSNSVGTVTLTAAPFKLSEPVVVIEQDLISKSTGTPIPGTAANRFTITQDITSQSCTNYSLSVLQWNADMTSTFTATPTSIPAGYTTAATFPHSGSGSNNTDTFSTTVRDDISTVYTFLVVGANTATPYTSKLFPDTYFSPAVTLPTPPGGTVPATNTFSVVTLP